MMSFFIWCDVVVSVLAMIVLMVFHLIAKERSIHIVIAETRIALPTILFYGVISGITVVVASTVEASLLTILLVVQAVFVAAIVYEVVHFLRVDVMYRRTRYPAYRKVKA